MSRTLTIIALLVVLLLAGGGLMLYLAYGVDTRPPAQAVVPVLHDRAVIRWHNDGLAVIEASGEHDAYAALGYVHGLENAWNIVLWRQTAMGRLSEWFGDEFLPIDRVVHRLGLVDGAEEGFDALADEDRALLRAYADGVNAALLDDRTALRSPFVLHELAPEPWQPWHTLAVERLFAWLATTPPRADSLAHAGHDAVTFFESDRLLRRWLHVHSFDNSIAWALTDSTGTHFHQRHVVGATAFPLFQEVSIQWPGAERITGATLPGTPYFPAGHTDTRAWAVLLYSPVELVPTVDDTTTATPTFRRVETASAAEHLVAMRRNQTGIYFEPPAPSPVADAVPDTAAVPADSLRPPADTTRAEPGIAPAPTAPDSTWVLRWPGLRVATDWSTWRSLFTDQPAAFELITGSGLRLSNSGAVDVLGSPDVTYRTEQAVFIGNTRWSAYAAHRLDSLITNPAPGATPRDLLDDRHSTWAAQLAPPMVEAVASIPDQPPIVVEAITYLRNWDFAYDRASIAASIFDTWVTAYRDSVGSLPDPVVPDTLLLEHILRYRMLVRAVDSLAEQFGTNLSQWRWERVQPRRYFFPGWSVDTLLSTRPELVPIARYAPLDLPGSGHPTTLAWGPSLVQNDLLAPAHWEGWISTGAWDAFEVRRHRFDADDFFGRYLVMDRPPGPVTLSPSASVERLTLLLPPGQARADTTVAE